MQRLGIALLVLLTTGAARAQDAWPSRPIRALTTSSAGGISDVFMRVLGEELRGKLGQPIVVENRPGGSSNVGTRACNDAAPDGYTICIINEDPVVYNQFLFKNLGFNPQTGLQPITNLFFLIQALVVNSDLKVKTVDELIAASKAKVGTMSYLTASVPLALYMETLKKEKGADWVRVPFKGGGDAVNAVLSGSTPIALIGIGNVLGQIRAGKMTLLVMGNNIQSPLFPDVPTLEQTGYHGPASRTWYGLFAPAGTPRPIVDRLAREVAGILARPDFQEKYIVSRGLVPAVNTPDEFRAEIARETEDARKAAAASGLTPQ